MSAITETQAFNNLNLDAFTQVHAGELEALAAGFKAEAPITPNCSVLCG